VYRAGGREVPGTGFVGLKGYQESVVVRHLMICVVGEVRRLLQVSKGPDGRKVSERAIKGHVTRLLPPLSQGKQHSHIAFARIGLVEGLTH
jgi:hypothetical protein